MNSQALRSQELFLRVKRAVSQQVANRSEISCTELYIEGVTEGQILGVLQWWAAAGFYWYGGAQVGVFAAGVKNGRQLYRFVWED